jgi:hypothetical protein
MKQDIFPFIRNEKLINKLILVNSLLILIFSFSGFFKGEYIYYRIGIWGGVSFCLCCYSVWKKKMDIKLLFIYLIIALLFIAYNFYKMYNR